VRKADDAPDVFVLGMCEPSVAMVPLLGFHSASVLLLLSGSVWYVGPSKEAVISFSKWATHLVG
jgi:hypothetical protein